MESDDCVLHAIDTRTHEALLSFSVEHDSVLSSFGYPEHFLLDQRRHHRDWLSYLHLYLGLLYHRYLLLLIVSCLSTTGQNSSGGRMDERYFLWSLITSCVGLVVWLEMKAFIRRADQGARELDFYRNCLCDAREFIHWLFPGVCWSTFMGSHICEYCSQ